MSKVYCIGGASGSGKTAIKDELQNGLGDAYRVYDFDDIGVPIHADKQWRQETTERWLNKLLKHDGDVCLLGQIVLGEVLACPSASRYEEIGYLLLDVEDMERLQRLEKRGGESPTQDILNWAAWLRIHTQRPEWAQHVIKEGRWQGLLFNRWDTHHSWQSFAKVNVLNTTGMTIQLVTEAVAKWIKSA